MTLKKIFTLLFKFKLFLQLSLFINFCNELMGFFCIPSHFVDLIMPQKVNKIVFKPKKKICIVNYKVYFITFYINEVQVVFFCFKPLITFFILFNTFLNTFGQQNQIKLISALNNFRNHSTGHNLSDIMLN